MAGAFSFCLLVLLFFDKRNLITPLGKASRNYETQCNEEPYESITPTLAQTTSESHAEESVGRRIRLFSNDVSYRLLFGGC